MFLRKLTVVVAPLLLLAVLTFLVPLMGRIELFFFEPVVKGVLLGVMLALMLPIAGADRSRAPFAGWLWVPAFITMALILWQYVASTGVQLPVLNLLVTSDTEVLLVESIFCGYLFTQCIRTRR